MNELALFAGAGGGLLGSRLLGWRTICAVELDAYRRKALLARQNDEVLNKFPVWDDIKTFDGSVWCGSIDVVSGGFPCQPYSTASHGQKVAEDLWPEMLRVVCEVGPRFVFAENVSRAAITKAAHDLALVGFKCCARRIDAGAIGANHKRPRWWLVADAHTNSQPRRAKHAEMASIQKMADREWWREARHLGVDDGLANRMDRARALGDGQVPAVVALAWERLT